MKSKILMTMLGVVLLAPSAQAGTLTYTDGRGGWKSTMCVKPTRPDNLPGKASIPASDLNERVEAYNAYAAQTQAYFDCVQSEVERDAQAAQYVLTEASRREMQTVQDDLTKIQAQLQRRKDVKTGKLKASNLSYMGRYREKETEQPPTVAPTE